MLNVQQSLSMHQAAYLKIASDAFADAGSAALRRLLDTVALLYQAVPPEALRHGIVVIATVTPNATLLGTRFTNASQLASELASRDETPIVAIDGIDSYVLLLGLDPTDTSSLSEDAIVYRYDGTSEMLHARGAASSIPKIVVGAPSAFANPTYTELEEGLARYRKTALDCGCDTLAQVWEGGVDGPRLVMTAKPEAKMRDSLFRALSFILRHGEVTREHSTDANKPVDLRVRWNNAPVEALIEVKWIGRSLSSGKATFTTYAVSRANEGAKQLADYIERQRANSTAIATKGYLVVFDGRRKGPKSVADRLKKADALAFANDEIEYSPDYTAIVHGFQPPTRLFMRPRETHFAEAL